MKIDKVFIKNYRLLRDFYIDLEDDLSLIVGKNNTGKTSLLTALDRFLAGSDRNKFSFDDFNLDLKSEIKTQVESVLPDKDKYTPLGIRLNLLIRYAESDNLANLSRIMTDLDPDHYFINLEFGLLLEHASLKQLKSDYAEFEINEMEKVANREGYQARDLFYFLHSNLVDYFKLSRKSLSCSKTTGQPDGKSFIDLISENISLKDVIQFRFISARRDVTNKEQNSTLSLQTSRIYEKTEATDEQNEHIANFKDALGDTDLALTKVYDKLFKETVDKVSKFGGIAEGDSKISINSTLQHRDLLKGNTTVMYSHGEHSFPEYYNGLGYMNLISIIFEIEILLKEFKRTKHEVPADINLLFIEEPEAHTHPQMQYVFINNIKGLLKEGIKREDGANRNLQTVITTHSSHIASESDFNDIRYLKKVSDTSVIAKNLMALESEYDSAGEEENYRFLKQYLTLNKSELFFADKAILIEGDTERIILPAMMKKIDQAESESPLLSQNISIVEVGAYSHVFERFIDFIGLKTLIITDIDSAENKSKKACEVSDPKAKLSTNYSLKFFLNTDSLAELIGFNLDQKRVEKTEETEGKKWKVSSTGNVQLVFQTQEANEAGEEYHARSFEDAFFHVNKAFIKDTNNKFDSLTQKHLKSFRNDEIDVYEFAEKAIGSKPSFAIEILLNSKTDSTGIEFSNWVIPAYIKEGLTWLRDVKV
ncbi:AAA family ATPase [Croceimicrobium hydrocarbonivorans]|uniref:AAA family ATPase n=1 Tax=Croceimicrobium hydrocarbonivorans TaxID=2761580 RepID=A0A7H0VEL1_9FLAO|nr:ATP-dependent endonuclease [Croceimicrobium hydrocarbonivorans]QNR24159.1 AAA family ATPase [Croceimicrobium hydrocarbonivorans]